jgi:hypothetical protein
MTGDGDGDGDGGDGSVTLVFYNLGLAAEGRHRACGAGSLMLIISSDRAAAISKFARRCQARIGAQARIFHGIAASLLPSITWRDA